VLTLTLVPVGTDDTAMVVVDITDPDAGTPGETPIVLSYSWQVNGVDVVGASTDSLDGTHFAEGDVVAVAVVADDGRDVAPAVTATMVVANTPPTLVSITTDPAAPTDAQAISAPPAGLVDADGDPASIDCQWQRLEGGVWEDMPEETGVVMEACGLSGLCEKDDQVRALCTPTDGEDAGIPVASDPITVLTSNLPPVTTACFVTEYSNEDLLASASGVDADGDTILWTFTWSITNGSGTSTVTGASPLLPSSTFDGGPNTVTVTCTPRDDEATGVALTSAPFVHTVDGSDPTGDGTCAYTLTVPQHPGSPGVRYIFRNHFNGQFYTLGGPGRFADDEDGVVQVTVPYGPLRVELYDTALDGIEGMTYTLSDATTSTVYVSGSLTDGSSATDVVYCDGTALPDTGDTGVAPDTGLSSPEAMLLLSEVVDWGDDHQLGYVEIYNAEPVAVRLAGWAIARYSNGSTTPAHVLLPDVVLPPEGTWVVGELTGAGRFADAFGAEPDQFSGFISGNGDDVYALAFAEDDGTFVPKDVYGVIGVDGTGEPWEYTDTVATRDGTVLLPTATWDALEWTLSPARASLGVHPAPDPVDTGDSADTDTDTDTDTDAGPFGFVLSEVTDYGPDFAFRWVEIHNADPVARSLDGWSLQRYANGGTTPSDIVLPDVTVDPGGTFVVGHTGGTDAEYVAIFGAAPDLRHGFITGNGDDAYALGAPDGLGGFVVHDVYGVIGVDGTGENWEYTDGGAQRLGGSNTPATSWDLGSWTVSPGVDSHSLGVHP
jgi:hypothetical protein